MNPTDNVIYGVHPVREAVRRSRGITKLYVAREKISAPLNDIIREAEERHIPLLLCSRETLDSMCRGAVHQGVAAVTEPFSYAVLEEILAGRKSAGKKRVVLILDGILDPGNLGSLIRSAALWGVQGVIMPKNRSARVTPAVVKAAAGGTEYVSIARVTNLSHTVELLKKQGFWIYGADHEAQQELGSLSFGNDIACVIGGEGRGIRPLVKRHCDVLFRISTAYPIPLNAAVAGAVILYEIMRQGTPGKNYKILT